MQGRDDTRVRRENTLRFDERLRSIARVRPLYKPRQVGQTCVANRNCDAGLHCETCVTGGGARPRCTKIQTYNPQSKANGLPFNRYSWLTTHNSFAQLGLKSFTGVPRVTFDNQQDSVTDQLNNGVRGLMLDMYDFQNDIWLCHSFGGNCYNFTAFQPAINVLKEIQSFLQSNPSEIITIFIEDYVTSPQGLTKVFDAAGLRKYWFPVSRMPKNGGDWPLISDMVSQNQRLIVFTSKSAKEASEGIAYNWRYVLENQYGDDGMKPGLCPNRAESPAMNSTTASLVLVNHFPTNPNPANACRDNSASLLAMVNTCEVASGNRWPNFITVDFYRFVMDLIREAMEEELRKPQMSPMGISSADVQISPIARLMRVMAHVMCRRKLKLQQDLQYQRLNLVLHWLKSQAY
ncbi:PI-PLC X domain-containing protein [Acorus gramineus]|uniref:PI-PLC X domain-containing protein n=1 Tax=Acorus gramineus TaxID=55184 RepID=A0AAV9BFS5_ACOGR|nr:PI-PLC X domain-containing protein [Acorus gramineus]